MSRSLRRFIHLLAILCVVANGLAWAGHVDIPAAATDTAEASAAHGHVHDDGDAVDNCDHCCHAGAHLLAVPREAGSPYAVNANRDVGHIASAHLAIAPEPPFIPPIA